MSMYFSKSLLVDLLKFAVSRGADLKMLSQKIGVHPVDQINPIEQISYQKMVDTLSFISEVTDDENLGLHLAEELMLKGTEYVDNIMKSSPSIEEAFQNAVSYSRLISDALICSMEKNESTTKISFDINPNWAVFPSPIVQQIIDLTLTCTFKSISWLTQKNYSAKEVHLNYLPKKYINEYFRIFDCSIKFKETTPAIIFQNPIIEQSIASNNPSLLSTLKEEANQILKTKISEADIINSVKSIILENLPQKSNLQEVANKLHLSTRTLQRSILKNNTTFKEIEADILISLSKKLIVHESRNLDEVAYLLGFSESSSFIRFFKKKMGITPIKYRATQK